MTLTGTARRDRRRGRLLIITVMLAALTVATGTACAKSNKGDDPGANQGLTNIDKSPGAGDGSGDGGSGDGGSSSSSPSPSAPPSAKPSTTRATPKGPVIVSFGVAGGGNRATCGASGPDYSSPALVILTWKVTGASSVSLSIDDPNFPKNNNGSGTWKSGYPATYTTPDANGEYIPFACTVQGTNSHKYTIAAVADGVIVTKTITATADYNP